MAPDLDVGGDGGEGRYVDPSEARPAPAARRGPHRANLDERHDQSPHPSETVRFECILAAGLNVTEAARRLGCSRPALSRVLNGRAAVSASMALAFGRESWSSDDFWMRRQTAYDLAQARRRAVAA